MATMWKKTMLYLGLGSDEDFEEYDREQGVDDRRDQRRGRGLDEAVLALDDEPEIRLTEAPAAGRRSGGGARAVAAAPRPVAQQAQPNRSAVRPVSAADLEDVVDEPVRPHSPAVRPIPPASTPRPHVLSPVSFDDAKDVADRFKGKQPVIVNLQNVERDLSRRLIDFASGLCYGLGGRMEKVADQVYLLTPTDVHVSPEERRRLQEAGLVDR